jgi:ketol-acid reductoisomerase
MKKILAQIQDGSFAREWIEENKSGGKNFAALRESERRHPVEGVGAELRGMMSWLRKDKDKDKQAPKSAGEKSKQVVNA